MLRCFVGKVSNGALLRFLLAFFGTLQNFMLLFGIFLNTIWFFLTFYAVLSQIRFVIVYALFRVKYFWLKTCLCKKIVFLHVCLKLFGAIWSYLEIFRDIWSYLKLFGAIWIILQLFGAIWSYLEPFGAIYSKLDLFGAICSYSKLFGAIWSYLNLFLLFLFSYCSYFSYFSYN